MTNITVEIVENNIITTGKFSKIEHAVIWINDRRKEKIYSEEDIQKAFMAGRRPTMNREPFEPVSDFQYMTFESYIR